jgi:hypothetical protein
MRISLVCILSGMGIVFGQALALAQTSLPQGKTHSIIDTLEIHSGAAQKTQSSTVSSSPSLYQGDSVFVTPSTSASAMPEIESIHRPTKKLSRKEILKIPLEELLDLPMETVLEYAIIIDSIKAARASARALSLARARTKKSKRNSTSTPSKTTETLTLDKFNATLEQIQVQKQQTGKKYTIPVGASREEVLRMKLKDLLDMRLGEILKFVNPVLASSATSGAKPTPR